MIEVETSAMLLRDVPRRTRHHRLVYIPNEIVEKMRRIRNANNRVRLMEQFGISDNTWRKIRHGQGLRRSVAERLLDRFVEKH